MGPRTAFVAVVCMAMQSAIANAGILVSSNNHGMPGFTGTTPPIVINGAFGPDSARIDYSVFGKGDFNQFLDDNGFAMNPQYDNSVIYAYQIRDVSTSFPNFGINTLNVGMDTGDPAFNPDSLFTSGTAAPSNASVAATSVNWSFFVPDIETGDTSEIVFFESTRLPEFDSVTLASSGAGGLPLAVPSPGPIPEPASLAILLLSILGAIGWMRLNAARGR